MKAIHRSLRSGGVLLDVHPQPEPAWVEVLTGARSVPAGYVDNSTSIGNVHAVRVVLASLVAHGYFAVEREIVFDFLRYFDSVEEWLAYMAEKWTSAVVGPAVVARARELVRPGRDELRLVERVRAVRLKRLARESNPA